MKLWKRYGIGLALFAGLAHEAGAQVPGAPPGTIGAPPGAAPGVGVAAPAPAPAAPANLWTFLLPSKEQKARCKAIFCETQMGKLLTNSLAPTRALTGGVLGGCCPEVSAIDLAKPPDSAEGAAARIKADEAAAKERRAAVRYLGTVDCNWWPEAQAGLINSLRADRNVCVRLEAALALQRGCCCNRAVIAALTITVEGSTADDNPRENSECVRAAAQVALELCLSRWYEDVKVEKKPVGPVGPDVKPDVGPDVKPNGPVTSKPKKPVPNSPAIYYRKVMMEMSDEEVIREARRVLEKRTQTTSSVPPSGSRSLASLVRNAFTPSGGFSENPSSAGVIRQAVALKPEAEQPAMPAAELKFAATVNDEGAKESKAVYLPSGDGEHMQQFNRMPQGATVEEMPARVEMPSPIQVKQTVEELPAPAQVQQPAPMPVEMPKAAVPVSPAQRPAEQPRKTLLKIGKGSSPKPQAVNHQPAPVNYQPAPMNHQPLQVSYQPVSVEQTTTPVVHVAPAVQVTAPVKSDVSMTKLSQTVRYSASVEDRIAALHQMAGRKADATAETHEAVVTATEDLVPFVREAALRTMMALEMRSEAAAGAVVRLQSDSNPAVRACAAEAFAKMAPGGR